MIRLAAVVLLSGAMVISALAQAPPGPRVRLPYSVEPYQFYTNHDTGKDRLNDCRSIDNPCKTLQHALEIVGAGFDFNLSNAQVNMACDVTDTTGIHFSFHSFVGLQGGAGLSVRGCGPERTRVHKDGGTALGIFFVPAIQFYDISLSSDTSCLSLAYKAKVYLFNVWLYDCGSIGMSVDDRSDILVQADFAIKGKARMPFQLGPMSSIEIFSPVVTIDAALDFDAFVTGSGPSVANFGGARFVNPHNQPVNPAGKRFNLNFGAYLLGGVDVPGHGGNTPLGGGGAF